MVWIYQQCQDLLVTAADFLQDLFDALNLLEDLRTGRIHYMQQQISTESLFEGRFTKDATR